MGEHKGWFVRLDKRSGRHRGSVWLPSARRYKSKTWDKPAQAKQWAMGEAAKILQGETVDTGARVADLRTAYLDSLTARGRSASHMANVSRTLDGLERVAPDLAAPKAAAAIERWLDDADVAAATRNRMLVEVRALVRWAQRRDRLVKDPTRAIERASVPAGLRAMFSLDEAARLLALPTPDPVMHRRVAILLLAGLRSDEAAALLWRDIDLVGGTILVRKREGYRLKRGRERIVPLQPMLRSILGEPGAPDAQVSPLGTFRYGPKGDDRAYRDANFRNLMPLYVQACGVEVAGRSAHSCRHCYAGLMTATGVPGALLSAYLGHTSAGTTMLYTRMAARYVGAVSGWPRGELRVLGDASAWPLAS